MTRIHLDRAKYLDDAQYRHLREHAEGWAMLDAAKGRRQGIVAWMVIDLALQTGLRVGELARIRVGDLDLSGRRLTVSRLKRRSTATETIPMARPLARHLREFLAWKRAIGEPVGDEDALVRSKRGPMTRSGMQKLWSAACRRAGLRDAPPIHGARHTLGMRLMATTGNVRVVQRMLGHTSIATTAVYAHVTHEQTADALDRMMQEHTP